MAPSGEVDGAADKLAAATLRERDAKVQLSSYTNLYVLEKQGPQLVATRGKGIYVYDEDGKELIEGMSGLWCTSLGWGEERLIEAATQQMRDLAFYHSFTLKSHPKVIELSEMLLERAPVPMSRVLFCNSGSEANDTAIKIVWYYNNALGRTKKKKIISRLRGYHGVTVAAASLTGLPANHKDFDLPLPQIKHTSSPHYYKEAKEGETEEQFVERCAKELEELIVKEGGADEVAAMFCEPALGAGGVIMPPKGYYEAIQKVLKKYDVLLIADEVINGFGRTGNFWGSQTFNIEPDMLTCAKALSSAYLPISALMLNAKIHGVLVDQSVKLGAWAHGFTYSGHPVSCAVAVETLKIMDERGIVQHVRDLEPLFAAGIKRFAERKYVGNTRSVGLLGGIELVADKSTRPGAPFDAKLAAGPKFVSLAQKHGVIVRVVMDTIGVCPPLIITEEQLKELFKRLEAAMDEFETVMDEHLVNKDKKE
ncbi:putative aminotransferase [Hyaloraphidium curvatum]|nr:putative aminotransferase [Hyaloraphidium curvatum]